MAEKIKGTDTLRQAYPKINDAIEEIGETLSAANTAKITADLAKAQAESIQAQFNQVIIEGDSSVEAAQARVPASGAPFQTLKDRLDASDAQLAQTSTKTNFIVSAESYGAKRTTEQDPYFDSSVGIQAAIDYVASIGGGTVTLPAGKFRISSKIILKRNVALIGQGMSATIIMANGNLNDNLIELESAPWNTPTYQRIENLTINGNFGAQSGAVGTSHGIYAPSSVMYTYINNVEVTHCNGDGLRYVSSHRNVLGTLVTTYNRGNGITVTTSVKEGTGTTTDNHVEMGYITADRNEGHGVYFDNPVDTKCLHITATNNTLDGIYIEKPSGGWGNMIEMVLCMNNRNGLAVYQGADLQIGHISITGSTEWNMKIEVTDRVNINSVSLFNGTLGNLLLRNVNDGNFGKLILRNTRNTEVPNLELRTVNNCNFKGVTSIGGLDGIWINSASSYNQFLNVVAKDNLRYGIHLDGTVSSVNYNTFGNVLVRNPGSEDYPNTRALICRSATHTCISNFRNIDNRTTKYTDHGVDFSNSAYCSISSSICQGKVSGIRKTTDNTTSVIGSSVIQKTITDE